MLSRRPWTVLSVSVAVLAAVAGASAAQAMVLEDDEQLFNFGYDSENHTLLLNRSSTGSPYDCTLEGGTLVAQYGAVEEGRIPVLTLENEAGEPVEFTNRPAEEVESEYTPGGAPVEYAGPDGECGLAGGMVGGPNGQINHGQFMKLFHQLSDKDLKRCLNRAIAQSGLGKGDQQLRTPDVDEAFAPEALGTIQFTTLSVDCARGKAGEDRPGKPDKPENSERPEKPGNSGNAPGRNK